MTVIETAKSEFAPALPPAKRLWLVYNSSIVLLLLARVTRLGQVRRLFPLTHAKELCSSSLQRYII